MSRTTVLPATAYGCGQPDPAPKQADPVYACVDRGRHTLGPNPVHKPITLTGVKKR